MLMRIITCYTMLFSSLVYASEMDFDESSEQELNLLSHQHFYLGGQLSRNWYQDACISAQDCFNDASGYGLYVGYQFTPYIALESGIASYGKVDANNNFQKRSSADVWGGEAALALTLPVTQHINLHTKFGGAYIHIDKAINDIDVSSGYTWNGLAALGASYHFSKNWALRGEYAFIDGIGDADTGKADLHSVRLGMTYRFGQASTVPQEASLPESHQTSELYQTNEPYNVEELSHVTETTSLTLETVQLFDFDSSEVKYSDSLEQYVSQLAHYDGDIDIIGYTDSTGSTEYNQNLSELRAKSVAEYFKRMGISEDRIQFRGLGATEFKATNDTEYGRSQNRRVEIRFTSQVEGVK